MRWATLEWPRQVRIENRVVRVSLDSSVLPMVDIIWSTDITWAGGWKPRIFASKRILNPWFSLMAHIMSVDHITSTTGLFQHFCQYKSYWLEQSTIFHIFHGKSYDKVLPARNDDEAEFVGQSQQPTALIVPPQLAERSPVSVRKQHTQEWMPDIVEDHRNRQQYYKIIHDTWYVCRRERTSGETER